MENTATVKTTVFAKRVLLAALCALSLAFLMAACTAADGGGDGKTTAGEDSLVFSLPSDTYGLNSETVYRYDSTCYPAESGPPVCYAYLVSSDKIFSFPFTADSLSVPRAFGGHEYTYDYRSYQDGEPALPCRLSLEGLLKTTIGSGSSATKLAVPASIDSARFYPGNWRYDQVLYSYLRATDPALASRFDTGGVRPKDLPAKYVWGGRKATYQETFAYATTQLNDQCETYFAGDSVSVYDNVSPCGSNGYPACSHLVPVCSDTGKEYQSLSLQQMSNDQGTVYLNTELLENSNMTYTGTIQVTCPE